MSGESAEYKRESDSACGNAGADFKGLFDQSQSGGDRNADERINGRRDR